MTYKMNIISAEKQIILFVAKWYVWEMYIWELNCWMMNAPSGTKAEGSWPSQLA